MLGRGWCRLSALMEKIEGKTARLAVVGLGYVGLPLAVEKAKAGYSVTGIDRNPARVQAVKNGENYIGDVVDADLAALVGQGRLSATVNLAQTSNADCVCLCVPTPLDAHQQPDLRHLEASLGALLPFLHRDMLLVLESTTYPGTTAERIVPRVERAGFAVGRDIFVAYSPERVDPGNRRYSVKNTPKVVGGATRACTAHAAALYERVLEAPVVRVSSPAVAEMGKLLENVYRNVNIALVNELAQLCERMGVSVWEVIEAASTKPYGFSAFYPGLGPGGHCIPLDPWYLSWKAREFGFHTTLIEDAGRINDAMPAYCAGRLARLLGRRGMALRGARILLLGAAYKADVADARESPALKLAVVLLSEGAQLKIVDPFIPQAAAGGRRFHIEPQVTPALLDWADAVVVGAAHSCFDYEAVAAGAKCILDTKNAFAQVKSHRAVIEPL
jgi:UDP-N-acetyl-D-glucosamine dehydrogenase